MPSTWSQEKYIKALKFAAEAHNGQTVPGSDLPYIVHVTMVAMEVIAALAHKTRVAAGGPDRGADVIASPDGLGLEQPRIRVEVKHRNESIGAPALRSFIGGLRANDRGLFVSTGGFTREARYEAERSTIPVTLIDIDELADLLIRNYDNADTETKALIPLVKLYWPA